MRVEELARAAAYLGLPWRTAVACGAVHQVDMSLSKLGSGEGRGGLRAAGHGVAESRTRLSG